MQRRGATAVWHLVALNMAACLLPPTTQLWDPILWRKKKNNLASSKICLTPNWLK